MKLYPKHIPTIVKPLAKDLVFNLQNEDKKIYLTFDDGPHPEITPWVLDQLQDYHAKATFFLIGNNLAQYPAVAQRILDEGHQIGNHTYDHVNGWKTKNSDYFESVTRCQSLTKTTLFRPPYAKITRSQSKYLTANSYRIIMYTDLSADFDAQYSVEQVVGFATKKVTSGSIIVFHDSEKAWPRLQAALPQCLAYYRDNGFQMEAIH